MTHHDDDQLIAWLHEMPPAGSEGGLERALNITHHVRQRPAWLVSAAGGTIRTEAAGPTVLRVALVLGAVAAVTALLLGSLAAAGILRLLPAPSPLLVESPGPSTQPQVGVVAYMEAGRIWVMNADATGAHELLPDVLGELAPIAWSPDGSGLLYRYYWSGLGPRDGASGLALTDAAGSAPEELFDFGQPNGIDGWCPTPADNCSANPDDMTISPDGTRLAYAIREGNDLEISTIVILDVPTGQIRRLESTRTQNPMIGPTEGPTEPCTEADGGYNGFPNWSPDGTRLVFTRTECHNAIFTVNADGSDLREITPFEWGPTVEPRWSPDGSRILFHSPTGWAADDLEHRRVEITTVRPDGTGLQALTSDEYSVWPYWTKDGRIVFVRSSVAADGLGDLWIMDGDGRNARQIDTTVPALTAAGCTICPRPFGGDRWFSTQLGGLDEWLWQPLPVQ